MGYDHEDFGPVRRLLGLKRYEQPPPEYFTHFSIEVIARIKAGEGAHQSLFERLWCDPEWLHSLRAGIETKPVWARALGVAAWALLIAGGIYAVRPEGSSPIQGLIATKGNPRALATFRLSTDEITAGPYAGFSDPNVIPDSPFPWSSNQGFEKPTSPFVPVSLLEPR